MQQLLNSNLSIHLIATGAGSTLQSKLWSTSGCSSYLSGASFPYATEETEEILGFTPESFCSEDTAIDLASAAYMKAFRFKSGKNTVGIGVTASVASTREHRGDHRVHVCIISDDKVVTNSIILTKGIGDIQRQLDDAIVEDFVIYNLMVTLLPHINFEYKFAKMPQDATDKAIKRFMQRSHFKVDGSREALVTSQITSMGILSGAFNPPHYGHFGMSDWFQSTYKCPVVFEVSITAPHKSPLSIQEMLQRAKMLKGRERIFTKDCPLYIDKNQLFNGVALVIGADAMQRMLDPKWIANDDVNSFIEQFAKILKENNNRIFVFSRDGLTCNSIIEDFKLKYPSSSCIYMFEPLEGKWDINSTELRK